MKPERFTLKGPTKCRVTITKKTYIKTYLSEISECHHYKDISKEKQIGYLEKNKIQLTPATLNLENSEAGSSKFQRK